MSYRVPDNPIESSDEEHSFYSPEIESHKMSDRANYSESFINNSMIHEQQSGTPIAPEQQQNQNSNFSEDANISNISLALYQALVNKITGDILNRNPNLNPLNQGQYPPSSKYTTFQSNQASSNNERSQPLSVVEGSSRWAQWNGSVTSIDSHIFQMKVKIEEQRHMLGSDRNICLSIFNSIPYENHPRIINWFETGGPDCSYNWSNFLIHIKDRSGDKQARQTAGNLLNRMRMGLHQLFSDILQDFEMKLSQCGGQNQDDGSKIFQLEAAINGRLRDLLLAKSMPIDNYQKWVAKARSVAGRLENTPSYQPPGCSGRKSWYLPQNSTNTFATTRGSLNTQSSSLDADGDTKMNGVNNIQALINALNGASKELAQDKPRAKWRSLEEFRTLSGEGKCIRCQKKGHKTRLCPDYRAAKKPVNIGHLKNLDVSFLEKVLSQVKLEQSAIDEDDVSGED